jgi:prevent-host-death family protein
MRGKIQNRGSSNDRRDSDAASQNDRSWQIQTAKARFSEVFRLARSEGPQRISRQGKESVVMVSQEQYERLVGKAHQPKNIVQFFRESPFVGVELDLDRDRNPGRDVEL